jgi:anti-sigma factor RsiW
MKEQMNDSDFNQLLEAAARRNLDVDEEERLRDHLAKHPSSNLRWEEETSLTYLLHQLPDAPLSSNFTAQVLAAVEREEPCPSIARRITRWIDWQGPLVRFAGACLFLGIVGLSYHQYQTRMRTKMAVSLANVTSSVDTAARAAQLQPVELWQDFESIYRLSHTQAQADEELLAALR